MARVGSGGTARGFVLREDDHTDPVADLERQLAQYVALTTASGEAMWRCDYRPRFHYSYLNPAAVEILDVTLDELSADQDLAVRRTHPEDRQRLLEGRADPAGAAWPMDLRWADRQGDYMHLLVREIPILDERGDVRATLGIARNLTDLDREAGALRDALDREQRAVGQLRAVDDLRQTFLRAVSHELRTPLAGVLGYAETLREHRHHLPEDSVSQLVERLVHNATRLRDLLDDLLDIDRLARGTLEAERRPTDVSAAVLRAVELVGAPLGQVRVDVEHVTAEVDGAKLERIVDNLVHNAVRHAGPDATVWVRLTREGDDVVLVVEDNGPGIPAELRDQLFEPFEQGSDASTDASREPGSGSRWSASSSACTAGPSASTRAPRVGLASRSASRSGRRDRPCATRGPAHPRSGPEQHVGSLTFFYGTMNCGKSTLALQMHHNATAAGKVVLLLSKHDRGGASISSRLGLRQPALTVGDDTDLHRVVVDAIRGGTPVDGIICDEAQFLSAEQVEQLARVADDLDIDVRAFGLLSDFTTRLFPGSQRLLELADHREELQLEARCWCGAPGTHNARTVHGQIVREGEQVVVGDIDAEGAAEQQQLLDDAVAYEVLCRRHHRAGITRRVADGQPEAARAR